jgi:hypothetical protein
VINSKTERFSKYCPEKPTKKQFSFINAENYEALLGGGVGGGKTSALLMAYLTYVDIPGYHGLILRRTIKSATYSGGPLQRSREWFNNTDAHWNEAEKKWTFPSGATLTFGYIDNENDIYQYQGTQWSYLGFDELTHFCPDWYFYLVYERMRQNKELSEQGVKIRTRATANPDGPYFPFVMEHFVNPGSPERLYIPSTLADNPGIDAEDYLKRLANLPEDRKRKMIEGIWEPDPPKTAIWKMEWIERNKMRESEVSEIKIPHMGEFFKEERPFKYIGSYIGVDPAVTSRDKSDDTGIVLASFGNDGNIYVRADLTGKYTPDETVTVIRRLYRKLKEQGESVHIRYESNQGGDYVGTMIRTEFDPSDQLGLVVGIPSRLSKEERAMPLAQKYEKGLVKHVIPDKGENPLYKLEYEMAFWNPVTDKRNSPNRLDALVVACHDMIRHTGGYEIRQHSRLKKK